MPTATCALPAAGIVAVIDTGVDVDHPTLKPVLVPGYDFTRNSSGADEKNDLNQATAAVLDGTNWVNGGTAAGVDQATAAVLATIRITPPSATGRWWRGSSTSSPPTAKIMPVKAFGANGRATPPTSSAPSTTRVNKGAKVLNMSFSRPTSSLEMKIALDYAAAARRHRRRLRRQRGHVARCAIRPPTTT